MKLIDFLLNAVEDYDGELFSEELDESPHSFVWNNDGKTVLTEEGKEQFKNILNAEVKIIKNGNIKILDKNVSQEEYDLFLEACAGYVPCSDYDKWFNEVKK